jgi:hypothetical protein
LTDRTVHDRGDQDGKSDNRAQHATYCFRRHPDTPLLASLTAAVPDRLAVYPVTSTACSFASKALQPLIDPADGGFLIM